MKFKYKCLSNINHDGKSYRFDDEIMLSPETGEYLESIKAVYLIEKIEKGPTILVEGGVAEEKPKPKRKTRRKTKAE